MVLEVPPPGTQLLSLTGHTKTVTALAWSPDGQRIASSSEDNTVRVWNAWDGASGSLTPAGSPGGALFIYKGHTASVYAVAWSPDGQHIASAGKDKSVQVWNAATGQILFACKGHEWAVRSLAWSPDGKRIASASDDTTVRIWDSATGNCLFVYQGHTKAVLSLSWAPDGISLASGSSDATLQVWNPSDGSRSLTTSHESEVRHVAYSPDGILLASVEDGAYGSSNMLHIWQTGSGNGVGHQGPFEKCIFAWSPNFYYLVATSWDKTIQIWNDNATSSLFTYRGHSDNASSIAWSPDGYRIASVSKDSLIHIWSAGGDILSPNEAGGDASPASQVSESEPVSIESADGQGNGGETIAERDPDIGRITFTYHGHDGIIFFGVEAVAWSPDGTRIASAGRGLRGHVWNVETGQNISHFGSPAHDSMDRMEVVWSPDGNRIAVGYEYKWRDMLLGDQEPREHKLIRVFDAATGNLIAERGTWTGDLLHVHTIAWSPDSRVIATGYTNGFAYTWDPNTGSNLTRYGKHPGMFTNGVGAVAWSPDGTRIALGNAKEVQICEVSTCNILFTYKGHGSNVRSIAWSPDSKLIATMDPTAVHIWDPANGALQRTHPTGDDIIFSDYKLPRVAWSPDGRSILAAVRNDYSRSIQIWDAVTGEGHFSYRGEILDVNWAPHGPWLVMGLKNVLVNVMYVGTPGTQPGPRTMVVHYPHVGDVNQVAWSPDGNLIGAVTGNKAVEVWRAATGTPVSSYKVKSGLFSRGIDAIGWSPDSTRIAAGSWDKQIHVINANQTETAPVIFKGHTDSVRAIAWKPGGRSIASSGKDKTVQIWSASSGQLLQTYRGHNKAVNRLAWSALGQVIASAGEDNVVHVWSPTDARTLLIFREHTESITGLAWSPDGTRIASSAGMTALIWDAFTGRVLVTYYGHAKGASFSGKITSLAWSADGTRLASSNFSSVQIWDASSGDHLFVYPHGARTLAWSPDGTRIASSNNQWVDIWQTV